MSELSLYLFNVLCTLIIFFSTRDCEPFSKSKIHGFFKREIQKNPFVSAALISHVLQPLMVYMWTASSFTGVSQRQNNTISPASQPTNCFYSIWGSNWCHGLVAPYFSDRWSHIRKKKKDRRKGKGRRSVWGEECIQFIAVLAILPRTIMKNRLNASFFSNHPGAIHPIIQIVQCKTASMARRRPLPFLLSLSFFYEWSTYTWAGPFGFTAFFKYAFLFGQKDRLMTKVMK